MVNVLIVVDDEAQRSHEQSPTSSVPARGVTALKQAILGATNDPEGVDGAANRSQAHTIEIVTTEAIAHYSAVSQQGIIFCPLTLNLPDTVPFAGQSLYHACRDVNALQNWVTTHLGCPTGTGQFWLPIVLTARGPLYGEVIAQLSPQPTAAHGAELYYQPLHLPDRWRQSVYRLAQQLLRSLSAIPSVYLMQFGFQQNRVLFDRLFPFPVAPAIASLGVQTPDLFTCHWHCLSHQPIYDLTIVSPQVYRVYEPAIAISSAE